MGKDQAIEWAEAQKITFSIDLVEAAKNHLKFLAAVDRNRHLYEDHTLERAIYRYNAYWLPMLAKHLEKPLCEEALVVPLDCEWIWHSHRLNPLRYKSDCEKLFGGILGFKNVVSSTKATSTSKTEAIWKQMYPEEPYELDMSKSVEDIVLQKSSKNDENFTTYDLLSAVKRQILFTFQTSRDYMTDELYLQEAEARYKGFLHIIRYTERRNIRCCCVPTYDVDLMWHTHQLYPDAYCNDLTNAVGRIMHHNDQVDKSQEGNLLETGFSQITQQWKDTLGSNYWKAGTLKRGNFPTPVTRDPIKFTSNVERKEFNSIDNCDNLIQFPSVNATEVLLEFVELKNFPKEHIEKVMMRVSKKQPDTLFNTKRSVKISSETGGKRVTSFKCETTGEFLFELVAEKSLRLIGSCSLSFDDIMTSSSQLSADKWLTLEAVSADKSLEPMLLHVSVSYTPPTIAPRLFRMVPSNSFPKVENYKMRTQVLDQDGKDVFSLYMGNTTSSSAEEVYCITSSGEKHTLAEFVGNHWCLKGSNGSFKLQRNSGDDDGLFELVGDKMVKLFRGRRLEFEIENSETQTPEHCFLTAVEFSVDYPYGKAVALIDFKLKTIKAVEEWIVLPAITSAIIAYDVLKGKRIARKIRNANQNNSEIDVVSAARCYCLVENEVKAATIGARKIENAKQSISKSDAISAGRCFCIVENEVEATTCEARNIANVKESISKIDAVSGALCSSFCIPGNEVEDAISGACKRGNAKESILKSDVSAARCYCLVENEVNAATTCEARKIVYVKESISKIDAVSGALCSSFCIPGNEVEDAISGARKPGNAKESILKSDVSAARCYCLVENEVNAATTCEARKIVYVKESISKIDAVSGAPCSSFCIPGNEVEDAISGARKPGNAKESILKSDVSAARCYCLVENEVDAATTCEARKIVYVKESISKIDVVSGALCSSFCIPGNEVEDAISGARKPGNAKESVLKSDVSAARCYCLVENEVDVAACGAGKTGNANESMTKLDVVSAARCFCIVENEVEANEVEAAKESIPKNDAVSAARCFCIVENEVEAAICGAPKTRNAKQSISKNNVVSAARCFCIVENEVEAAIGGTLKSISKNDAVSAARCFCIVENEVEAAGNVKESISKVDVVSAAKWYCLVENEVKTATCGACKIMPNNASLELMSSTVLNVGVC